MRALALAVSLLAALLATAAPTMADPPEKPRADKTRPAKPPTITQLLAREKPAIVTIYALDGQGQVQASGTAFIVRSDGILVTNLHIIRGAQDARIQFSDGQIYDRVLVLDYDELRDLAILKIRALHLPTVTLGNSDNIEIGDKAVAIGNPRGLEHTVSDGLISGVHVIGGTRYIQTTAAISPGSSGGPLYCGAGQVVGVTTMALKDAQHLNFAVPLKYALELLQGGTLTPRTIAEVNRLLPPPPDHRYTDPTGRYSVTLPAGWEAANPTEGAIMKLSNGTAALVMYGRGEESASAIVEAAASHFREKGKVEPFGEPVVKEDRLKAQWMDITLKDGTKMRGILMGMVLRQGGILVIGLSGEEKASDQKDLIEIAGSLTVK